jgi:hypothetical protein
VRGAAEGGTGEAGQAVTSEEMERGQKGLQDNMTVQGVMMNRLENNLDRLELWLLKTVRRLPAIRSRLPSLETE